MSKPILYSAKAEKTATKIVLDQSIFELEETNHQLMSDLYQAYLANGRTNNAKTKTRGLVSGGGKKPWRQKGTGRARFGSSRVPIWRGGGIAFGPTGEENYTKKYNVKSRKLALKHALTTKFSAGSIKFIESLEIAKTPSTKKLVELLTKLDAFNGNILIVLSTKTDNLMKSASNIPNVKIVRASYINIFDILNANQIIIDQASLEILSTMLVTSKETK